MNSGNLNKLNVFLVINSTDEVNSKWINFEFREEVFSPRSSIFWRVPITSFIPSYDYHATSRP